jgi:fatty-acid peroxygenase
VIIDQTLDLLRRGYVFTADARHRERSRAESAQRPRYAVTVRLLGRPATVVGGEEGVRLFYDQSRMKRHGAMPQVVGRPLFGRGAVHNLDGETHRHRKSLFVDVLMNQAHVDALLAVADDELESALDRWALDGEGTVYPAMIAVYGGAVIRWAGIVAPTDVERRRSHDLAVIVDGFATPGLPYARAWRRRIGADRWAKRLVEETRAGVRTPAADTFLARVAGHRDLDGRLLDAHTAGVELLNVLRPIVAVARLAAFAALALGGSPSWRERLSAEIDERGNAIGGQLATAFAQEVRRVHPFVPLLAARATRATEFEGCPVPAGRRVLLDVMATNHDPELWDDAADFRPERFLGTGAEWSDRFVPQGGGRPETGHRCPGELVAVGLLALTSARLAERGVRLVPGQDVGWSLRHVPALPRSGTVVAVDPPRLNDGGGSGSRRPRTAESMALPSRTSRPVRGRAATRRYWSGLHVARSDWVRARQRPGPGAVEGVNARDAARRDSKQSQSRPFPQW